MISTSFLAFSSIDSSIHPMLILSYSPILLLDSPPHSNEPVINTSLWGERGVALTYG